MSSCLEYVGFSTYYRHHRRFFNIATNQWIQSSNAIKSTTTMSTLTKKSENACEFGDTTVYNHSAYSQESGTYEGGSSHDAL